MTIYIDHPQWWWRGRRWSHLISDTSLAELHAFADRAELRYLSFGRDHYDVPEDLFLDCQILGAELTDPRDIVRMLRRAGLREGRGKSFKSWRPTSAAILRSHGQLSADGAVIASIVAVARSVGADVAETTWLTRPGELVVLFELGTVAAAVIERLPDSVDLVGVDRIVATMSRGAWFVEVLVLLRVDDA